MSVLNVIPYAPGLVAGIALRGTLLLLAAACAAWLLRRASASARHLAWGVGLAALLALPVLALALPAWRVAVLPAATAASVNEGTAPVKAVDAAPVASAEKTMRSAEVPMRRVDWVALVTAVWAVGALLAFLRLVASVLRVRADERCARVVKTGPAADALRALVWRLEMDRPVRLLEGGHDAMPLTWGIRRPRVLLPAGTESWPADRLESVLLHELAHVRRRDCAWQLVAEAACALHWFNPLAWAAARRLRLESEHACDDQVLLAGPRGCDYASHLLEIARTLRPPRAALAHVAMARPSQLRTRLYAVLSADRPRTPVSARRAVPVLAGAAALVAAIAALTPARAGAALPAPQVGACVTESRGSSTSDVVLRGVWRTSWSNRAGCGGRATIRGDVRFTAAGDGVADIAPGGRFQLELSDGRGRAEVDIRPSANGLRRAFRVDGRPAPWDAAADRWLAAALPELLRHTTYDEEHGAPSEPADPAIPAEPAIPADPAIPGNDVAPVGPVTPVAAVNPAASAEPAEPREPGEPAEPAEPADPGAGTDPRGQDVPEENVDDPGATTVLSHDVTTDGGPTTNRLLLARNVQLRPDRRGIARISADGWVVFRETSVDGVRRVRIEPGPDGGFQYRWSGDFQGTDRDAWLQRMITHFITHTRPQTRW